MPDKLEDINGKIKAAEKTAADCRNEIITLASADTDPKRNSPTAKKITELDIQRKAAVLERRKLKAERAELMDIANVLAQRKRRREGSARSTLKAAIGELSKTKEKGGAK